MNNRVAKFQKYEYKPSLLISLNYMTHTTDETKWSDGPNLLKKREEEKRLADLDIVLKNLITPKLMRDNCYRKLLWEGNERQKNVWRVIDDNYQSEYK